MLSLTGAERRRAVLLGLLPLLALLASVPSLFAADYSWDGSTNTAWSNKFNWTPKNNPTSTDNAKFDSTFTNQPSISTTAESIGGIWMTTGVGQNVTIGGTATLTL